MTMQSHTVTQKPDLPPTLNQVSIDKYRHCAAGYDASAQATMPLRLRTIALLGLQPGDVVLDVGAGTGLSYAFLRAGVNADGQVPGAPRGRVLAIEQSPDMFAQARARVAAHRWDDVWQVCASAETVQLPQAPNALLFNYTHDITRQDTAVDNLLRQADPQARVALAGMKFFPWWTGPLNLLAWAKNRPYNALAADLWSPWDKVQARCRSFQWQSTMWGMGYVAHGTLNGPP